MARVKGTLGISANFEPQIAAAFDARANVPTKADLILAATWVALDSGTYVYNGMTVTVSEDSTAANNGIYVLLDTAEIETADYSGWLFVGVDILNNTDNFVLTATGNNNQVKGNSLLVFDGDNLGIGGTSTGPRLEINDNDTGRDLLLINNINDQGIKVQSDGVLQIIEFGTLPTAVDGGLAYSSSNFYIGL
jgi:hypothetical protein|tara:strand:+ start:446 stop:1021 length:576 start_codon:yes stop_codon:yes gene_type:complete